MGKKIRSANGVKYYRHTDNDGIVMVSPKTIGRYIELGNEHPNTDNYGVFFAFGKEQFEKGRQQLISKGYLKESDKVCSAGMGMFGTKDEIHRYLAFYEERNKKRAAECNPQEVYFHEWNNHECMISNDDDDAMEVVISLFGNEAAHKIKRINEGTPINILAPLTERDKHLGEFKHELDMMWRYKFDVEGFFSEHDCRKFQPRHLYGGSIGMFILELRETFHKLPDDIKDASPLSRADIDKYAERLTEWACEEFSKPEYDPVPDTKYADYKDLEIKLDSKLYYKDDDGNWQTPTNIWFSCDTRRWRQDERMVHGRAMTMYPSKKGTSLTPVYTSDFRTMSFKLYRRDDLCNVSCDYQEISALDIRLTDFYRE